MLTEDKPSPFIEDSFYQYAWDSTSLGWLKECPRKYYYHMIEGWRTRGETVHLDYGILVHEALEGYDRLRCEGADHDSATHTVIENLMRETWRDGKPWRNANDLDPEDKASLKNRENLIRTVVWYLEKYKNDPASTKRLETGAPMVELHFQFETGYGRTLSQPYTLCGHLDRVVEFQGEPFVMDRKTTTTTLGTYYYEQFDPDNQMTLYAIAAQVAFKTPVKGVIVEGIQIASGFSRFGRSIISKTQDQLDEWMRDFNMWMQQAETYARARHWPMNDRSCHKFGGCTFRHICSKSPSVRDKFLESGFERKPWNPLIPREPTR